VLEGYYDDSGKEDAGPFVCLAGYLAPNDTHWMPFFERWAKLLMLHDLPELHMKTFHGVATDKGWDGDKRNAVLSDFVEAIRTSQLIGFGVGIDTKVWKTLSKERRRRFGTAQEFAMQRILRMTIEKLLAVGLTRQHVNVVFDQDEEFCKPRLTRYFAARKADRIFKEMVPIISFADAKVCYPLQAADLLVWLTRRCLISREMGTEAPLDRAHLGRLVSPPEDEISHYAWEFWGAKTVERELTKVEKEWARVHSASSPEGQSS
jgi:hypothetical protein